MKSTTSAFITIIALMIATSAFADNDGTYVLAGVGKIAAGDAGQSTIDSLVRGAGGEDFSSSMSKPTTYKLQIGYQLNDNLALEGGYVGSQTVNYAAAGGNLLGPVRSTSRINGWDVVGVAMAPLGGGLSVLGKLGFANMQELAGAQTTGFADFTSGSKVDITYGIGAKYDFANNVFLRLDVDRYDIGSSKAASSSTIATFNIGYKFF
jgi:OOP family OmpA-OmpF porin